MLRRDFIRNCGLGMMGLTALTSRAGQKPRTLNAGKVAPRGSARNVVLVFLAGAPSHVDTFDLKLGSWTPADFDPGKVGNIELAGGLFPNLLQQTDKFSILRAIQGNEAVHQRASYLFETAHTFNPAFAKEQPHIGSLMAYELANQRRDSDILPTFIAMNGLVQGPGMLSSAHAAFPFSAENGVPGLTHPGGEALFAKRYAALQRFDANHRFVEAPQGAALSDYHAFYTQGEQLMYEPTSEAVFTLTDEDRLRYGDNDVGAAAAVGFRALQADRGTRVVQIVQGGWDHHFDIYDPNQNNDLYSLSQQLDQALATMLVDLAAAPGSHGGSLLDETLVVVTGEFGRTPGEVPRFNAGRDHYPYAWSALMAGGGIVPGQTFGATDTEGWTIVDPFWSQPRYITIQDVIATMYSSLGIDWSKTIADTPSGRVYEYTPAEGGQAGYYQDIREMFQS